MERRKLFSKCSSRKTVHPHVKEEKGGRPGGRRVKEGQEEEEEEKNQILSNAMKTN